jgi:hypothetical protein
MWYFAKALQLIGLVIVLNAVIAGIFWAASMGQELRLSILGTLLFACGYLLERRKGDG